MDIEDRTPSPKRRRTSSHNSSYSSRNSSQEPTNHRRRRSPNHVLPLRRADTDQSRVGGGGGDQFSESQSRDDSLEPDDRDRYGRNASNRQRRRSRSRSTSSSPRSASRRRSPSGTPNSILRSRSASYSPTEAIAAPAQKRLSFTPLFTLPKAHARGITSIKFSPDGTLLATSSADATINIYAVPSRIHHPTLTHPTPPFKHLKTLRGHLAGINALAWSPQPPYNLGSASDDKSILLWTPQSSSAPISPSPLTSHHNTVDALAFSPKGNMLVSGSHDEAVFLWDVRSARVMRQLPAHSDPVTGVDFLRDGTMVASCAGDGLIRLWDAGTGQCLRTLVDEDRKAVTTVRFTPNGRFVVAWTLDDCIRLWRYVEGTCVKTYQGHVNRQYGLTGTVGDYMSGTEAFLVSGSEDGDIVAWDITTKEVLWRGQGHGATVLSVDFCRLNGGKGRGILVSGGFDRDIRVWIEDVDDEYEDEMPEPKANTPHIKREETDALVNGDVEAPEPNEIDERTHNVMDEDED